MATTLVTPGDNRQLLTLKTHNGNKPMKHIEQFNKLFVPNLEPHTHDVEEIRLAWAVGLIAMNDLENECSMTFDQANQRRHELITRYIDDLRQATDFGAQNLSTVQGYWAKTIAQCKAMKDVMDNVDTVLPQLEYQRDIELSMLFAVSL